MGQYNLSVEEIKEQLHDLMLSIEGDFEINDFVKAARQVYKELTTPKEIRRTP